MCLNIVGRMVWDMENLALCPLWSTEGLWGLEGSLGRLQDCGDSLESELTETQFRALEIASTMCSTVGKGQLIIFRKCETIKVVTV